MVRLPGGARVRGRRLGDPVGPADFALVLARGPAPTWSHRRLRWPDFWIPLDPDDALDALDALQEVRWRFHPRAVETPWQRRRLRRGR